MAFPPLPPTPISLPERSNFWNRIVARSAGLDETSFANTNRAATSSTAPSSPPTETPASAIVTNDATARANVNTTPALDSAASHPVTSITPSDTQTSLDRRTAEANQTTTATPAAVSAQAPQTAVNSLPATAIDPSYRLGPGDSIQVNFFNVPEYSGPQQVLADGTINMPAVGGVPVTGLTLAEAEQAIAARYSRELRNIRVTVSLTQARPLQIGVAGEVRQPGFYVMTSGDAQAPSVAQAIQAAGGATQLADLRQIQVRRTVQGGTSQTVTVDLWALLQEGDQSQNLALRDGDTIVIPPTTSMSAAETEQLAASNLASNAPQSIGVSVVGEVGRPGAYRLDTAAGNRATLTQAIQAAGGITPEANLQSIEVQRTARNGTVQTTTLDLWQLVMSGDLSQDLILQTGDRITLAKAEAMTPEEMARLTSSSVAPSNIRVNIAGEATSPGSLQLPANTTLNQALLAAGGLNRRARDTVRLIRINPNGTLTQRSIEVDWERGIDPENNPILFNNDVILVGRSSLASFSDGASNLLEPFFRILPVFNLF
ncbi:MAG: sugar ABC transporter substrate-binding protein [Leptolyngbyaceae cyanobacterium SL_5_9]|nr:sugar ABC transporter substrate-binding protein [Leptolyngbyaceae cyanobacterium SL_5_9]NJO72531.1 sugar ABC transporter substrate-binding protein [Leptolyngbyaceae cyanobacterium RM1_406_9]